MKTPLLRLHHIGCSDKDFIILDDINWDIYEGKFYQIVGSTSSGKTTLLSIMGGYRQPTSGSLEWCARTLRFKGVSQASMLGIRLLEDLPNLYPDKTIAENIVTASIVGNHRVQFLKEDAAIAECRRLLEQMEINLQPERLVNTLSLSQCRIVELLRVLYSGARLLLVDSFSGWCSDEEAKTMYRLFQEIAKRHNCAVVFCPSCFSIDQAGRFSCETLYLKAGKVVSISATGSVGAASVHFQSVHLEYPKIHVPIGPPLLELRQFETSYDSSSPYSVPNDCTLHAGEILGLYGMDMPHCQALYNVYNGLSHNYTGSLLVDGKPTIIRSPRHAQKLGIACQPLSLNDALFWNLSIQMNMASPSGCDEAHRFFYLSRHERYRALYRMRKLRIGDYAAQIRCRKLSGGIRQKILISRYLQQQARIFILFNPTAGMDSLSKLEVYNLMNHLLQRGCGIVLFSNDPDELAYMCDSVTIVHNHVVKTIRGTPDQRADALYRSIL